MKVGPDPLIMKIFLVLVTCSKSVCFQGVGGAGGIRYNCLWYVYAMLLNVTYTCGSFLPMGISRQLVENGKMCTRTERAFWGHL